MSNTMQEQIKQAPPKQQSGFNQPSAARPQDQSRPKPRPPESVRELAYRLWEEAGYPEGQPERFWLEAEARINRGKHG